MLPERGQPDADVAPADFANPDPSNDQAPVAMHHETAYCIDDIHHGWNRIHKQYAEGAMNGFVASANPNGARALGYFDESDLSYYYALANTFSIGDRYFSEVLGPTYPNRLFAHSATSFGIAVDETPATNVEPQTLFAAEPLTRIGACPATIVAGLRKLASRVTRISWAVAARAPREPLRAGWFWRAWSRLAASARLR